MRSIALLRMPLFWCNPSLSICSRLLSSFYVHSTTSLSETKRNNNLLCVLLEKENRIFRTNQATTKKWNLPNMAALLMYVRFCCKQAHHSQRMPTTQQQYHTTANYLFSCLWSNVQSEYHFAIHFMILMIFLFASHFSKFYCCNAFIFSSQ